MEKPTCPDELRNEVLIIDFTKDSQSFSNPIPPETSLHRGLTLATEYLQKSIKPSTQNQVFTYLLQIQLCPIVILCM